MNAIAEIKLAKFGETLIVTTKGNPEPTLKVQEGVETRRRVCIRCSNDIPKNKYRSAEYCSERCKAAAGSYRWRVKHGLIKNPGVGSGGNQWGTKNHMYKNGIGNFSEKVFAKRVNKCARCGSTKYLLVHHIDHDRTNNKFKNLKILCKCCHQKHHTKRDLKTGQYIKV
jgi:hypothetical protein